MNRYCKTRFLVCAVAMCALTSKCWAHAGASAAKIDQSTTIRVGDRRVVIEYAVTLNRPAAFLEVVNIDANDDGVFSPPEQAQYFEQVGAMVQASLELRLNGREVELRQIGDVELAMPFTKRYRFEADHPVDGDGTMLEFHNDNYLEYDGAVTVTLQSAPGTRIVDHWLVDPRTNAPADELVQSSQVSQRDVTLRYEAAGPEQVSLSQPELAQPVDTVEHRSQEVVSWLAGRRTITVRAAGALAGLFLLVVSWRGGRSRTPRRSLIRLPKWPAAAAGTLLVLLAVWPVSPNRSVVAQAKAWNDEQAKAAFRGLHENIYQAFACPNEDEMYDLLAQSLEGDLLTEAYLKIRQTTLLEDDGGAVFDIRRVKPLQTEVSAGDQFAADRFRVRHRWRVYGTVSHFGHRHTRINEYAAVYTVAMCQGSWRIVAASPIEHHRVDLRAQLAATGRPAMGSS